MTTPRAVVLAAGRGSRLGPLTAERPKPLLDLGGVSLLGRQLRQMEVRGVRHVTVVTGYRGDLLSAGLGTRVGGLQVACLPNPDWDGTGSGLSLLTAGEAFASGDALLLTHGDIAYSDRILDACLALAADGSATAGDAGWKAVTGDEVVAWSGDGWLRGVRKGPHDPDADAVGEYIGVSRLAPDCAAAFAGFCAERVAADRSLDYEIPLLSDFVGSGDARIRVSYTHGVPWVNVNYREDLDYAREHFGGGEGT